jgi:hypothetical protein
LGGVAAHERRHANGLGLRGSKTPPLPGPSKKKRKKKQPNNQQFEVWLQNRCGPQANHVCYLTRTQFVNEINSVVLLETNDGTIKAVLS